MKELIINIQEGQQTTTKMNSERLTLRHIIIKHLNVKNKIFESSSREVIYHIQRFLNKTHQISQ